MEEAKKKLYAGRCFMDVIHQVDHHKPDFCRSCLVSKDKGQLKKLEEMFQDLQIKEGNTPCFELRELCTYSGQ